MISHQFTESRGIPASSLHGRDGVSLQQGYYRIALEQSAPSTSTNVHVDNSMIMIGLVGAPVQYDQWAIARQETRSSTCKDLHGVQRV